MGCSGRIGYDGLAPTPGSGTHRYRFELFALDRPLQLEPKIGDKALRGAMAGTIIDRTTLIGTYRALEERVHGRG